MQKPFIFLFSSERSGSNLLASIIGNHSGCSFNTPTHLFRLLYLQSDKYLNAQRLLRDAQAVFNVKLGKWENEKVPIKGNSIKEVLSNLYCSKENNTQIIKELQPWKYLSKVNKDFPSAKSIYLVRDPRDVFISMNRLSNLRLSVTEFSSLWKDDQKKSLQIFKDLNIDFLTVRYEDLLTDPTSELTRITDYLGIDFEESMLKYHRSEKSNTQASQLTAWENINKPLLSANFNKFYNYLTYKEVKLIERFTSIEFSLFGYKKADSQHFIENPLHIKTYIYSDKELKIREKRKSVISKIFNSI